MIISRTTSGQIVSGTVLKWKPGSGSAADRLTILTIDGGDREIKVLCWNPDTEYGRLLSDQARKLMPGTKISVRAEFDVGDENKCTAYDIKTSGIYEVNEYGRGAVKIIQGKVREMTKTEKGVLAYIPSFQSVAGTFQMIWNCIFFPENSEGYQYIRKNQTLFVYFSDMEEIKHVQGMRFMLGHNIIAAS